MGPRKRFRLTTAGWLVAGLVVVLTVIAILTSSRGVIVALGALVILLGLGELSTWPATRAGARARGSARTRIRGGPDPGTEAAREYERHQGWRR